MADKRLPPPIDWFLFAARWSVYAASLLVSLFFPLTNSNPSVLYGALIVGSALNLIYLVLLSLGLYRRFVAIIAQVLDIAILLTILYATGEGHSPLFLLAIVPVVGGAMRFGVGGGLTTALVFGITYAAMIVHVFGRSIYPVVWGTFGLTLLLLFVLAAIPRAAGRSADSASKGDPDLNVEDLRKAHERLKTIYQLTSAFSATLSHERVLDALLDASAVGLYEPDKGKVRAVRMVLLYSPRGTLQIAASRNLKDQDIGLTFGEQEGLVQRAMRSAEPALAERAEHDPDLKWFASLADARSLLVIPLRAVYKVYGAVLIASPEPQAFIAEHVEMLTAFCSQAVLALQNAQLYQSVQEDRRRIIDTQEDIRRQLARELHDGPTQSVSAIAMRLNFTKMLVKRDPERATEEIVKLEDLARRTAKEIRTMLFALRPLSLETQGLTAALQQYAEKLKETEGLTIKVESDLDQRLVSKTEAIAFSIIEEAVNNAKKHAKANNISIRVRVQQDWLVAEVEDDGRGFDLSTVDRSYDQRGSLGLINMRERAILVSGNLSIKSEPGKGTLITLLIPLTDANLESA